jgi:uncharacterized membrane protein YfcA
MTPEQLALLCAGLLVVSFLYSSVGHAGASGYIAVMTLAGLSTAFIKPTALILNIFVACLSTWQFYSAGHFRWGLFWPFALLSIPCAFLGGYLNLPVHIFKILVGIILWFSAVRFLMRQRPESEAREPKLRISIPVGGALGFLSGITGTGGGIFLTPLLILMKWARTKNASATSALFILVNSISGLAGNLTGTKSLPPMVIPLVVTVVIGGAAGSYLGSRKFSPEMIKKFLACVLLIAGCKLIFT